MLKVSTVFNRKYYRYSAYIPPKYCQHSKYSSCLLQQMGMELSNRCTNGRVMLFTPSIYILGAFGVLRVLAVPADEMRPVRAVPAVQNPEILASAGSIHSQYRTPKFCVSGSIRSPEPRSTERSSSIPQYISPEIPGVLVEYSAVHKQARNTPSTRRT